MSAEHSQPSPEEAFSFAQTIGFVDGQFPVPNATGTEYQTGWNVANLQDAVLEGGDIQMQARLERFDSEGNRTTKTVNVADMQSWRDHVEESSQQLQSV